jgi:hypothetical protein
MIEAFAAIVLVGLRGTSVARTTVRCTGNLEQSSINPPLTDV